MFSLDNAQSWEEVYRLRDMIIEAKNDPEVPIGKSNFLWSQIKIR